MTKSDLVQEIAKSTGFEKTTVTSIVEDMMEQVKTSMIKGENIYLRGFGTFLCKKRAEKTARNISKNTSIIIPAHYIPKFKPAPEFTDAVAEKVKD